MPRQVLATLAAGALVAAAFTVSTADARRRDHRRHADAEFWKARAAAYEAAYDELSSSLDRIERLNDRRSRRARKKIQWAIERARTRAAELIEDADTRVVVDERPVQYETMGRTSFARLRTAVADASFARERLRLIESAAEHNAFTVHQVLVLLSLADFETTKVEMAVLMYPYVVDDDEWYRVYESFDFDSSKKKLRKRIRQLQRADY